MSTSSKKEALVWWRSTHEWECWGCHGGLCESNGFTRDSPENQLYRKGGENECWCPVPENLVKANRKWLTSTDAGFNYLEYGRWNREERQPVWPYSPGTSPRYRK